MLDSGWELAKLRGWSYDVASGVFQSSAATKEICRPPGDELQSVTLAKFLQLVHPADRDPLEELAREVLAGGLPAFSYRYRVPGEDRRTRFIVGHAQCGFGEGGKLQRVYGTLMDVTEQMHRQQEARLADAHLHAMSDSGGVWWWEQDAQFRFTSFADTRDAHLSSMLAASLGRRRWEFGDAHPCSGTWDDHRRVCEARQPFRNFEYRRGSAYFSATGLPSYSADGEFLGYRGTAHDITARKQAEDTARENETLLRLASRLGKVGAWAVDEPSMRGTWSRELLEIYDLPPGTSLTTEVLFELVEPGWREMVRDGLRRCHRDGVSADVEFPSRTASGRAVWLHLMAVAVRDADGAIRRIEGAVQDITQRRQHADRLRQLSNDLTATFESITDALLTVDAGLRCTFANAQAERLTHRGREELLGSTLGQLFPRLAGTAVHDELVRVRQTGCTGFAEMYDDASQKWFSVTLYPLGEGVTLIVRDVTETYVAQRALAESEERYRLLFETSADGIIKVGLDFRILHANRAACRMFGRTIDEMRELHSVDLVSPSDARVDSLIQERIRSGGASGELTMVRADASTFDAEVDTSTYSNSAGETIYHLVVRDATERIALRRKLQALNLDLSERVRERTRELERANSELKGFARSLAHDLRQPIAAAKAFSNALTDALSKGQGEEAGRHARQVAIAASTMGEYVEALLSLAHISQVSLEIEEADLSALANSLLDQLQQQAPSRRLAREIEPAMYAEGDVTLLRMLLQNLLGNAWKFTARKEVARISFFTEAAADGRCVYCIRDNGAGFDMAHAGKLFGTFQRLHTQSEFAGTGIGLANAQRIVSRHGGRIWAESAPGKGATFRFTLEQPTGPQSRLTPLGAS